MKKNSSNRRIASLAEKLGAKPSEIVELLDVSRSYLHRISTGERPLNERILEKISRLQLTEPAKPAKSLLEETHGKKFCERKGDVARKKMYDLNDALEQLKAAHAAIDYVTQLLDKLPASSLEHDWCKLHLRRLKHRLPKQPAEQRAIWEAQLAGLAAEQRYWERVKG